MGRSESAARLAAVAGDAVAPLGLTVDDVTVTPVGKRRVVRIRVDDDLAGLDALDETSRVPPVSLDDVAEASRAIGAALDDQDVLGDQPYVLEVTSPGVDRPLTRERHFRRNVGRLVDLATRDGARLTGRIVRVGDGTVSVAVTGSEESAPRSVPIAEVTSARVQVEFGHLPDGHIQED